MKSPLYKFVYDRKKVGSKTKEALVELRVTYDYKQKYMSTGVKVLPKHWKDGCMVHDREDAEEINETLNMIMKEVRTVVNQMMKEGSVVLNEIPSRMKKRKNDGLSFLEYCEQRMRVRQHGLSEDSRERYERFMRFLRSWGKIVWFGDVTDANIVAMDDLLTARGMKANSKWNNYHRFLNSFIIDAMNDGKVSRNPYKWLKIDKDKESRSLDNHLTSEELEMLKKVECASEHLERARDLFVFQVYTCMAYVDLVAFDPTKIVEVKGRKMYMGKREKTGQEFSFLLMKPALDILEKYGGKLPIISNQKYNDYVKAVCAAAKIKKPVSTHWARHTGATLLLNAGVDMEVVAKVLGHSSTKITREVYAKLLDETVREAMVKVEGKI